MAARFVSIKFKFTIGNKHQGDQGQHQNHATDFYGDKQCESDKNEYEVQYEGDNDREDISNETVDDNGIELMFENSPKRETAASNIIETDNIVAPENDDNVLEQKEGVVEDDNVNRTITDSTTRKTSNGTRGRRSDGGKRTSSKTRHKSNVTAMRTVQFKLVQCDCLKLCMNDCLSKIELTVCNDGKNNGWSHRSMLVSKMTISFRNCHPKLHSQFFYSL